MPTRRRPLARTRSSVDCATKRLSERQQRQTGALAIHRRSIEMSFPCAPITSIWRTSAVKAFHESARLGLAGIAEHLARGSRLHRAAALEVDDLIGDRSGEVHVVRDDDESPLEIVEQAQQRRDFADEPRIERGGRLVEQHHVGLHRQRARNRDALLLPAGQARRVLVLLAGQPDEIQVQPTDFLRLRRGHLLDGHRRLDHVLERREVREEVEVLKDQADPHPQAAERGRPPRRPTACRLRSLGSPRRRFGCTPRRSARADSGTAASWTCRTQTARESW